MQTTRRQVIGALGATGMLCGLGPLRAARAAEGAWPQRPIRLVIPTAPGGPTDVIGRVLAAHVSRTVGQPLFVDNRVGGSTTIGTEHVARSAPDGYTALYQSSGFAILPALIKRLNFDALRSFVTVAIPAKIDVVLVASRSLPVSNIAEFFQYLKANPGKLTYGSGGVGNLTHLGVEVLLQGVGSSAVHVPYKGTAPAMADLLGGHTHFMLDAVNTALPFIRDHRVRALAVTGAARSPLMPDLPTVAQAGISGYDMGTWNGVLVPAGTPESIVQTLNDAFNRAAADDQVQRQLTPQGVQLQQSSPAQSDAFLRAEIVRWAKIAQGAGVQPE